MRTTLWWLVLACAALGSLHGQAEPPLRSYFFGNEPVPIEGGSKEYVCSVMMPERFHPQLNWRNTRFNSWSLAGPYVFSQVGFSCIGDSDLKPDDVRHVGFGWCDTVSSGDVQAWWYVDLVRERCVCNPNSFVTENGVCVAPKDSRCPFTLDGVCHGGKNNGDSCPRCGNPINPSNGNKFLAEGLYKGGHGLELTLAYNVQDDYPVRFGRRWRDSYDRQIALAAGMAIAFRGDGKGVRFLPSGGAWVADADTADRLTELHNPPGTRVGWQLHAANGDEIETYDAGGRLLSIASRDGLVHTLAYSDGTGGAGGGFMLDSDGQPTAAPLPAGLLLRVTDPFGRALTFGYGMAMRVTRITDPAGGVYRIVYDGHHRLVSVRFPDDKSRSYHYNEPAHTGGTAQTLALTGITDENGARFATYKYNAQGRAVSTEHGQGVNRYTLAYHSDGSSTVTDALGTSRAYAFENRFGAFKNTGIAGPACPSCGPASQTFDANGNVASKTDWKGNRTHYAYDLARNLETSRTEGLTAGGAPTAHTRTVTTAWHGSFRLPTKIAEPLRITTNVYDDDGATCGARGALCSRTMQATNDASGAQGLSATPVGAPRAWTYTYNPNGSVLSINGPRTDVADVTTYTYDAQGNAATIRNAAGHTTSITAYNAHGQALTIVDPNGLTTTMTYDERQRLKTRSVGAELTSYDYDGAGQLTRVTLPDGSFLSYGYDGAHRLTGMQDNAGNRIAYILDAMGNRTREQVFDAADQPAQTRSRVFDHLNRLFKELGAQSQVTEYAYDDQGNVLSVKDPLNHVTSSQYDALNRLRQVTDPALGVTRYAYNGLDALTQVTDPRNLVTGYTVDGLGNLTLQASPDTGATASTYDAAGNLLTQSDAKGQVTRYAYDALNRVALITFHDGSRQVYAYDQGANGLGRLSSITETTPANEVIALIQHAYDLHGRVTSEARTVGGVQYMLGYSYDGAGRLAGLTYPSGRSVAYEFDSLGRVSAVSTTKGLQTRAVVGNVAYHPFGGVKSFTLGNGQSYTRSYDQDGRIASYTLGSEQFAIGYDAASRIEFISEVANPANTNTYGYDSLDRLTGAVLPGTPFAYSYDALGNRLGRTVGSGTETLTYSPDSNRIASLTPAAGAVRSFVFDANGSTLADGLNTYAYDVRGRMAQATSLIGTTRYQVNALGQRIRKTNPQGDTVFHYDARGRLIAESDAGGGFKREILYLGDIPVGVVQ
jgi:YD repeat-containing protein